MDLLTEEQVLGLRLNTYTNIWTTGFIELDLDKSYRTPFGTLICKPGIGWHFIGTFESKNQGTDGVIYFNKHYPLTDFLHDKNIQYAFACPIIKKLIKGQTHGIVFKLLGFPHNKKCWT